MAPADSKMEQCLVFYINVSKLNYFINFGERNIFYG